MTKSIPAAAKESGTKTDAALSFEIVREVTYLKRCDRSAAVKIVAAVSRLRGTK
jgi:hypothetical protein